MTTVVTLFHVNKSFAMVTSLKILAKKLEKALVRLLVSVSISPLNKKLDGIKYDDDFSALLIIFQMNLGVEKI